MKNFYYAVITLLFITSCNKTQNEIVVNDELEQRNDNHLNYKLAHISAEWNYTLTDGNHGSGTDEENYIYSCSLPSQRAISFIEYLQEDGNAIYDYNRTLTYNTNGMIAVEHALENGDDVVRTFNYDSNGKWTGITTRINGVTLDDELTIGSSGQVTSYTNNGVRLQYVWKANNIKTVKIYVQPSTAMSDAQNSKSLDQLGYNKITNKIATIKVLQSLNELQKRNTTGFRGKNTDEWVLVQIEEQEVDQKVIQPFSSAAKGYPGSTADGGFLILPKNYIIKFTDYAVNEDGTRGDDLFIAVNHSYSVFNNLPKNVKYYLNIFGVDHDADGNPIDWHEVGSFQYDYISGCNE